MTEVRCPTCDRMLIREHSDGSFDLAPQAMVTAAAEIPVDAIERGDPWSVAASPAPLSARCLRCHPDHDLPDGIAITLPEAPGGAAGWDIFSTTEATVFAELRGWRRLWARLRGRSTRIAVGTETRTHKLGHADIGHVGD